MSLEFRVFCEGHLVECKNGWQTKILDVLRGVILNNQDIDKLTFACRYISLKQCIGSINLVVEGENYSSELEISCARRLHECSDRPQPSIVDVKTGRNIKGDFVLRCKMLAVECDKGAVILTLEKE